MRGAARGDPLVALHDEWADITAIHGDRLQGIAALRRAVFAMKGGVVYKSVARRAIPAYAGVEP
jgi:hypothetical protein